MRVIFLVLKSEMGLQRRIVSFGNGCVLSGSDIKQKDSGRDARRRQNINTLTRECSQNINTSIKNIGMLEPLLMSTLCVSFLLNY